MARPTQVRIYCGHCARPLDLMVYENSLHYTIDLEARCRTCGIGGKRSVDRQVLHMSPAGEDAILRDAWRTLLREVQDVAAQQSIDTAMKRYQKELADKAIAAAVAKKNDPEGKYEPDWYGYPPDLTEDEMSLPWSDPKSDPMEDLKAAMKAMSQQPYQRHPPIAVHPDFLKGMRGQQPSFVIRDEVLDQMTIAPGSIRLTLD